MFTKQYESIMVLRITQHSTYSYLDTTRLTCVLASTTRTFSRLSLPLLLAALLNPKRRSSSRDR
jgi:hypothetical protein